MLKARRDNTLLTMAKIRGQTEGKTSLKRHESIMSEGQTVGSICKTTSDSWDDVTGAKHWRMLTGWGLSVMLCFNYVVPDQLGSTQPFCVSIT